ATATLTCAMRASASNALTAQRNMGSPFKSRYCLGNAAAFSPIARPPSWPAEACRVSTASADRARAPMPAAGTIAISFLYIGKAFYNDNLHEYRNNPSPVSPLYQIRARRLEAGAAERATYPAEIGRA